MERFVAFTLRQKVVMNLLFVLLMAIGFFALHFIPVERYPNIQFGKMYIIAYLPGASPDDVEVLVTKKIEDALDELEEIEFVHSTSFRERSSIVVKFTDDSDYKRRFDDVRLKVLSMFRDLPAGVETPIFNFLDVNDWFPTISVNVSGGLSNTSLSKVADELKIVLKQLDGVKEINMSGDFTKEFHLLLSPQKLASLGLTLDEVANVLQQSNLAIPAGKAATMRGDVIIKVDEQFASRDDLMNAVIRRDGEGSLVRTVDVAAAGYFSYRDPFIRASVNGDDCVTLRVLKSEGGNAIDIAHRVRELVEGLEPIYQRQGISLTVTQDSSNRIKDSVRVLGVNLLVGVLLVSALIWGFMGLRNALLTTIGIPFSFLVTLGLMYITGQSINEVSLFAFVLVSGIIVDDAIVVLENIYRYVQNGRNIVDAVVIGTAEVFWPVVNATLTTIIAFLPMLIMSGMVGDFFALVPTTITYALTASLIECLLMLPGHYVEFGPRLEKGLLESGRYGGQSTAILWSDDHESRIMRMVRRGFQRGILFLLRHAYGSLALLGVLFLVSMAIFLLSVQGKSNLVRIKFFPEHYSLYYAEVISPAGTSLMDTHNLMKKLSRAVMADGKGKAESALGFAGYYINEDFTPQYGNNVGYVAVTLPTREEQHFDDFPKNDVTRHLQAVRKMLLPLVPENCQLIVRPEKDGPPQGKDINIRVLGQDGDNVAALAKGMGRFLRTDPQLAENLIDFQDDRGQTARVLRIRVDRTRVAELGLNLAEVTKLASTVLDGRIIGEMRLSDETIDIRIKMARERDDLLINALDVAIVQLPSGVIRLNDVCHVEYSSEYDHLNRFQNQRAITITANIKPGARLGPPVVMAKAVKFYHTIREQYPGATLNFAGEFESTQKSFVSLAYAFGIAIVLIYLVLTIQFQDYLQPLIIISAVVFALTGVIYGTILSRSIFTVNSFVAVVGVTGVVVNDSLVLVEFLNKCFAEGMSRQQALLHAVNVRLRPILLTTLTTTLGLLPMAIGVPEYSLVWGSMAMTFVNGLCTATFLTILFVPVQWDLLGRLKDWRRK